jgi:hypothetical protein
MMLHFFSVSYLVKQVEGVRRAWWAAQSYLRCDSYPFAYHHQLLQITRPLGAPLDLNFPHACPQPVLRVQVHPFEVFQN